MKKLLLASAYAGALCLALPMTFAPADAPAAPAPDAVPAAIAPAPAAPALLQPDDHAGIRYVDPADFLPQRVFAQPPARDSEVEKQELAWLHGLIAASSPERIARAKEDGEHENPGLYDDVMGRDLTKMPATWNLLVTIQDEADAVIEQGKGTFMRMRPYMADPTMPTCVKTNPNKSAKSYPSGHAGVGYSVGWALARLKPELAPGILARAEDYALSRQICGVHFPSDTAASKGVAMLVADRMLADPRLAGMIAAARAELDAN